MKVSNVNNAFTALLGLAGGRDWVVGGAGGAIMGLSGASQGSEWVVKHSIEPCKVTRC